MSPVSLLEPTQRPRPLLSSGTGLRGAFRIPSRRQEQEAQLAPCRGGTKGHPASPLAAAAAQGARNAAGCQAGAGYGGRGDGSWVLVARRDWGDGGCAPGCIPRQARRGELVGAFCYTAGGVKTY